MKSKVRFELETRARDPHRAAARVLVVDADTELRTALSTTLVGAGYAVDAVGTAAGARQRTLSTSYNLVILDLLLPDGDGQVLLQDLVRARPHEVVIVVSRVSDTDTKIRCMQLGARDYVTKPFSPRELITRMRLRLEPFAAGWSAHVPSPEQVPSHPDFRRRPGRPGTVRMGGLTLDVSHLTADAGHGPVRLTRTEFLLLVKLAEHADRPIPTKRLLTEVWGYAFEAQSNVVGVCVRRLRSKLGSWLIENVRGEGYRLVSDGRRP
jgi:DNA-binding response OmpR family regulator